MPDSQRDPSFKQSDMPDSQRDPSFKQSDMPNSQRYPWNLYLVSIEEGR